MRPFRAQDVTPQKRAVRRHLWEVAAPLVGFYGEGVPVLILPGRTDEEIKVVREILHQPAITAYDKDPVAVRVAAKAGVEAVYDDIANLPARRWWMACHYDDCGVMDTGLLARLCVVAAHVTHVLAVTAACRRKLPDVPRRAVPAVVGWESGDSRRRGARQRRVEVLAGALPGWALHAGFMYRSGGYAMLTTLWAREACVKPLLLNVRESA